MMRDLEQTIRERAYHIWIDGRCRDGHADAHWLAAQREILSAALSEFGRVISSDRSGNPQIAKRRGKRALKLKCAGGR